MQTLSRAPAPDAPAQLVQLRQPEALGVLDHHQGGVRHVHAHFDDRGGHQQLHAAGGERLHGLRFLRRRQAAVQQADAQALQFPAQRAEGIEGGLQVAVLRLLDHRADPVGLLALGAGGADAVQHLGAPAGRDQARGDGAAARRQFVDRRHVQVGVVGHRQRARNRRRAHHQLVRQPRSVAPPSCAAPGAAARRSGAARPPPRARAARSPRSSGTAHACRWRSAAPAPSAA